MTVIVVTTVSLGVIALVAGVILFAASKKFAVVENPLIDEVEELLPGANCGGCGFAGCRAFAEALVKSKDAELTCPVADSAVMEAIAGKVGIEARSSERKVARVFCRGGDKSLHKGEYHGIRMCSAAIVANTESLVCPYGCLGFGDCVVVCPFDCIQIVGGVAVVNEEKCTGCGLCVKSCPRNLIELVPANKHVFVACKSPDKGAEVKAYCSVGCIGCRLCLKSCPEDTIIFSPFLAKIIPDACTGCMACVEKCPTKTIRSVWEPFSAANEIHVSEHASC